MLPHQICNGYYRKILFHRYYDYYTHTLLSYIAKDSIATLSGGRIRGIEENGEKYSPYFRIGVTFK